MKSKATYLSAFVCLLLIVGFGARGHESNASSAESSATANAAKLDQLITAYGQLPLRFEANHGQVAEPVRFISRNSAQTLFLTANEAVLALRNGIPPTNSAGRNSKPSFIKMQLAGANAKADVVALDELPGKSNYLLGNDPRRWRTNVANFARVKYRDVYSGIDLIWHGNQRQLEHDFVIAPKANPQQIRLNFAGAQTAQLNSAGELVLQTEVGDLKLLKPVAWQDANGQRQPVACEFVMNRNRQLSFRLGAYDRSKELVIDPVLLYSTYLGGNNSEQGLSVAVDKDFNAYIVGSTTSTNFPGNSPVQSAIGGGTDAFVVKINPSGTGVVYGTYFGGTSEDIAYGVAVGKDGDAYVTGYTYSSDFPVSANAFQKAKGALGDAFIAKLNVSGSALEYASYLGGNGDDGAAGIAVDATGNAYLVGYTQSANLPANGFQTKRSSQPIFKSTDRGEKWNQTGNNLGSAQVYAIAVDPTNSNVLYVGTYQGLAKSVDGGQQWQLTGHSIPPNMTDLIFVNSVAIDPTNTNTIYAASPFMGIYKSTDGGQNYQPRNTGIVFSSALSEYDLVIDPGTPTTIYLGTPRGMYKSVNGADTWVEINNGMGRFNNLPKINKLVIDPVNRTTLYAATNSGVFKTTDGGGLWAPMNAGFSQGNQTQILSLAIDPTSPAILYAGTITPAGGLYKTTDGGASWHVSNSGLVFSGTTIPPPVRSLSIDPSNPQTVFAATLTGVFKSLDGGTTWNASVGLLAANPYVVVVDRVNPANVYVGIDAGNEGMAAKINPSGSSLVWLTYLGGATNDDARAIALDKDGNSYITGTTDSKDFPVANPFQAKLGGGPDAFVTKINPDGTALLYSTFFGGKSTDTARGIAVSDAGQAFIIGSTASADLPVKNPLQASQGGGVSDAFVAKFSATGTALEYSTWLGGSGEDIGYAIAVDKTGNAYVTGNTRSSNFPLADAIQSQLKVVDAFVTKLNATGTALVYSTYLGGDDLEVGTAVAVDSSGFAYVVGLTASGNFPTVNPLQQTLRGSANAFIAKLGNDADLAITNTVSRNPVMVGNNFSYELAVTNNGPSLAPGVVVTDVLPAGINFVSAASSQGSCSNNAGTVTCNVGSLAAKATATITLTVSASAAGSITNMASVKANESDSNLTNNQASALVTISSQPSVYGRITLANGTPVSDVPVNLTGALSANQRTNAQGRFQFANLLLTGNYTLTPTSSAYSFEPAVRDFNLVTSDQTGDFVATPCTYSLSATSQSFDATGGNGLFKLTAPPRCPWAITTDAAWIKITSALSGAGNSSVSFAVEPTAVARSGRISVGGQTFHVVQGVSSCVQSKQYFYPLMPRFLTTGDLNGDGYSDLLVGSSFSAGTTSSPIYPIGLLYGAANGQLTPKAPILAKLQPFEIAAGDFNGDGKVDVASIPFSFEGEAEIFLNTGAGGFGSGVNVPMIPPNYRAFDPMLRVADLNKDGRADLLVIVGPLVLVALSNSSGNNVSFAAPTEFLSFRDNFLSLVDVNGDGAIDLLMANRASTNNLAVYLNNGAGVFGQAVVSTVAGTIVSSGLADFNGDGKVDLAILSLAASPVSGLKVGIQMGDGSGKFGVSLDSESFVLGNVTASERIAVGDVNGDGKPDVVAVGPARAVVLQGNGAGGLGPAVEFAKFDEAMASVAVANFEADSQPEIALADYTTRNVTVLSNRCSIAGLTVAGRIVDLPTTGGVGGVTMNLTGARTASTVTDSGGNYSFTGLPSGNYTLTPERPSAEITPANRSFTLIANQIIDFSGSKKATAVSAASYSGQQIAQGSIVALFGLQMTGQTQVATQQPLPTSLGGMTVAFKNIGGSREYNAQLFFVSPNQINLLVPPNLSDGEATFRVFAPGSSVEPTTIGRVMVDQVAPGLFSADASGRGLAAAVALRVRADGSQVYEATTQFDSMLGRFVPVPIDVSNSAEQVFLLLFGTGISGRSSVSNFLAKIGGETVEMVFVGPQPDFAGLDQVNLRLPKTLAGRGNADVVFSVDDKTANVVQINIK